VFETIVPDVILAKAQLAEILEARNMEKSGISDVVAAKHQRVELRDARIPA
jgi:hypothetical protein